MQQVLNIARRELVVKLRRPTFWLATILVPLVTGALFLGSTLLTDMFIDDDAADPFASAVKPSGFVDRAGVVREIPRDLHAVLIPFPDQAAAEGALRDNAINGFFVIEPDYLQTGRVSNVSRQTSMVSGGNTQRMDALLRANLVADERLVRRLDDIMSVEREATPGPDGQPAAASGGNGSPLGGNIAIGLALVLVFSILNGGGSLVQAIAEEKENRTVEVVLTSVRPWQFMAGKLAGLGTMALVQLGVWILLGGGAFAFGGAAFAASTGPLRPGVWVWLLVFFVLGYLFYGGLLAAVGAVGATARESGQITGVLVIPLVLPLMFGQAFSEGIGGIGIALSMIPFTAPVTAIMLLSRGEMPAWLLALSVLCMLAGVAFALWLAARLFRATTLLSGARPTPRILWQAIMN